MPTEQPADPLAKTRPPRRRPGCVAGLLGLGLILALLAGFVFYRLETWPARNLGATAKNLDALAARVRDALVAVAQVQPKVTVNERTVFEQASPVLELAVVSRQAEVDREFTNSRLGSTKRIRLRGLYEVKAGFDLRGRPFTARVETRDGQEVIRVELPPAQLLGVEQKRVEVLELKNGLWNHVQDEELETEFNALAQQARLKALRANLPREAEETFTRQLRERLDAPGRRVEVTTVAPTPAPPG